MSIKIKVSYTEDKEALSLLTLLQPIIGRFKVKQSTGKPPFKHLYFMPRKVENPRQ